MNVSRGRPTSAFPVAYWAVLTVPFGVAVGFATIAAPYVLRIRGADMNVIANVSWIAQLPHVVKFMWSPALDAGARRRTWYFGSVAVAACCLAATAIVPPSLHGRIGPIPALWVYAAALFAAQAGVATSGSAVLALMALTVPGDRRGVAAGWQTAGNLVGTALGGALVAWMLRHLSGPATAVTLAGICAVTAAPAALLDEIPPPRQQAFKLVANLAKEVWATVRSRDGWTGLLLCLSPVGAGALTNLFSALAAEYAKSDDAAERLVIGVSGVLGGVANAAGALVGGLVADRMNRRVAYVLFGTLTALSAAGMMLAPANPAAFTVGCLAYQLSNGLCYAAFYAFVLDLLGHRRGVTTQLALYVGASNLSITYVTWLDGWSYERARTLMPASAWAGRTAMLGMDALSTFVGIAVLAATAARARRSSRTHPEGDYSPAPTSLPPAS